MAFRDAGTAIRPGKEHWQSQCHPPQSHDRAMLFSACRCFWLAEPHLLELAPNWRGFLARVIREEDIKLRRSHEQTGRPLGDDAFLATLEENLGRIPTKQKPGPKGRAKNQVWWPRNPHLPCTRKAGSTSEAAKRKSAAQRNAEGSRAVLSGSLSVSLMVCWSDAIVRGD
jgi:hypothetical protein